ncbi:hypothetical protein CYMTET_56369 [Cymbomonas tetramitiformis]|uniref:Uncharacterized protein n=1 Tax=Cymbomonas tetramitiformis TaxID=36881 RepID=A0AAE0ENU1_9CHLO|nr:hypothetical protein CYMTET_56369 [Cymbomonas tetramitiformis]
MGTLDDDDADDNDDDDDAAAAAAADDDDDDEDAAAAADEDDEDAAAADDDKDDEDAAAAADDDEDDEDAADAAAADEDDEDAADAAAADEDDEDAADAAAPAEDDEDVRWVVDVWGMLVVVPFVPAANVLVAVGFVLAERVLYLPSAGVCVLAGSALARLLRGSRPRVVRWMGAALVGLLLLGAASRTVQRNLDWRDGVALFSSGVRDNPGNEKLHAMLGDVLMKAERWREAEACFRNALFLEPDDFKMHYSLAQALLAQGNVPEAEVAYHGALRTGDDFSPGINGRTFGAHVRNKLGELAYQRGDGDAAFLSFQRAVNMADEADPLQRSELFLSWQNIGQIFSQVKGSEERAVEAYQKAMRYPRSAEDTAACNREIGILRMQMGQGEAALDSYKAALRASPTVPRVHSNMGFALRQLGRNAEAAAVLRHALRLDPTNLNVLSALGAALANSGHIDEATQHFKTALKIDPSHTTSLSALQQIAAATKQR